MVRRLVLNERLDSVAVDNLRGDLADAEGDDVVLDATAVDFLGGLCLELLLCALQVWPAAGKSIRIENPSHDFRDNLARFGLRPSDLGIEGAQ